MTLSTGQQAVLSALSVFPKGIDDQGLAVMVHHTSTHDMSSSGVRTRRAELVRKGLVAVVGVKTTRSGRNAAVHAITAAGKAELRANARSRKAAAVAA